MPKDTTIMMGSVWTELYQNKELNNQLYQVVKGRMPKKYNEVETTSSLVCRGCQFLSIFALALQT